MHDDIFPLDMIQNRISIAKSSAGSVQTLSKRGTLLTLAKSQLLIRKFTSSLRDFQNCSIAAPSKTNHTAILHPVPLAILGLISSQDGS